VAPTRSIRGYGFSWPRNARLCRDLAPINGLTFIGPTPDVIGAKWVTRRRAPIMDEAGVPDHGPAAASWPRPAEASGLCRADRLSGAAQMRRRRRRKRACGPFESPARWQRPFATASAEPKRRSKTAVLYVEKLIRSPRHIEVQVLGDQYATSFTSASATCWFKNPSHQADRRSRRPRRSTRRCATGCTTSR